MSKNSSGRSARHLILNQLASAAYPYLAAYSRPAWSGSCVDNMASKNPASKICMTKHIKPLKQYESLKLEILLNSVKCNNNRSGANHSIVADTKLNITRKIYCERARSCSAIRFTSDLPDCFASFRLVYSMQ